MLNRHKQCDLCKRLDDLEECGECDLILCKSCRQKHADDLKAEYSGLFRESKNNLLDYKYKIDSIESILETNRMSLNENEKEIRNIYEQLTQSLKEETEHLFAKIDKLRSESLSLEKFKVDVEKANECLNSFLEGNHSLGKLVKGFNSCSKKLKQIDNDYEDLKNFQIRRVSKFEKYNHQRLIGKLCITKLTVDELLDSESTSSSVNRNESRSIEKERASRFSSRQTWSAANTNPTTTSHSFVNNNSNLQILKSSNYQKWRDKCQSKHDQIIELNNETPLFLTTHRNNLFCLTESSKLENLLVFTINDQNKFEFTKRTSIKLPKSIRDFAANSTHFVFTYAIAKTADLKRILKMSSSNNGILFYRRYENGQILLNNDSVVKSDLELNEPNGLALNDEFICICDLSRVLKVSLKTGELVKKLSLPHSEMYKCAFNKRFLVVSDVNRHYLSLIDFEDFSHLMSIFIEQEDARNGPFRCLLTNDNIVFYKNYEKFHLVLTDIEFREQIAFKYLESDLIDIARIDYNSRQFLIVASNQDQKSKLLIYFV